ncbi:hypothetical protein LTS18_010635 [Coniosporium uncinatum]|uniref:Uncharacterized protein n=1 Tax=Coniosporium uncinatum TaxID=93489 RepID=A0ACC3DZB8_9PEZI|nr:hypothetical protein LTS18_010635 [Coniosporium uncinatum]
MAGPSIHFRLPPASYFKFPPDPEPQTLPPPPDSRNFASPFPIDATLYNQVLKPAVPVTIASLYFLTVLSVNKYNRSHGNKPWAISKSRLFFAFVLLHNIFLAIFSALTFVGMLRALRHTWPSKRDLDLFGLWWPGLHTKFGLAGAADALCKMHGPRGFGDAAAYNTTTGLWDIKNRLINLAGTGKPDPTDLGRIWNEGLAFWGWFFYLSKFYEVLDTFIILAKGKRSSTLQTYHHTGAMFCMWAGIRYMSSPIWMFCFINSGIHAMMYTYYTLAALGVKVPQAIKRTLTTMQIAQFLIGFTFAAGHLFVTYSVPVSTPYEFTSKVQSIVSAVSSAASEAIPAATSISAGTLAAWAKKLAYRAAGEEGLAENVRDSHGNVFGPGSVAEVGPEAKSIWQELRETRYREEYQTVPCIDTTGQSFAIWLNLIYLAPLTGLFVRFFIRSYTRSTRSKSGGGEKQKRRTLSESAQEAASDTGKEFEDYGKAAEDEMGRLPNSMRKARDKRRVSASMENLVDKFERGFDDAVAQGKEGMQKAQDNAKKASGSAKQKAEQLRRQGSESPQKGESAGSNDGADDGEQAGPGSERGAGDRAEEQRKKDGLSSEGKPRNEKADQDAKKDNGQNVKQEPEEEDSKPESNKSKDTRPDSQGKGAKDQGSSRPKEESAVDQAKQAARDTEEAARPYVEGAANKVKETVGQGKEAAKDAGKKLEEHEDGGKASGSKAQNKKNGKGKNNSKDKAGTEESQTLDGMTESALEGGDNGPADVEKLEGMGEEVGEKPEGEGKDEGEGEGEGEPTDTKENPSISAHKVPV